MKEEEKGERVPFLYQNTSKVALTTFAQMLVART
jgi:hypothetical protein